MCGLRRQKILFRTSFGFGHIKRKQDTNKTSISRDSVVTHEHHFCGQVNAVSLDIFIGATAEKLDIT